jgi:hypothetical protein
LRYHARKSGRAISASRTRRSQALSTPIGNSPFSAAIRCPGSVGTGLPSSSSVSSARRALANTFFLTVNTGLAALLGGQDLRWYVAAAGIVFAFAWWWLLQSYRELNAAKFKVINAIEPRLPLQLFSDEWQHLQNTKAPLRLRLR